jgi:hypothetical protein
MLFARGPRRPKGPLGLHNTERKDNMSKHLIRTGLAIASVTLAIGAAGASASDEESRRGRNHFKASLDGYQETPMSLSTAGRGTFRAVIHDDPTMGAMMIEYELSYEGLEGGSAMVAHIHLGQRATSGGVSAFLCGGSGKPECPPDGGTVSGVIVPSDIIGPAGQGIEPGEFEELVLAIRSGAAYANVHTTGRPGGEIRGQIHAHGDR